MANMNPKEIIFYGSKEPKMIQTNLGSPDNYFASAFNGKIIVPLDYEPKKATFLKKTIKRILPALGKTFFVPKMKVFLLQNFLHIILLIKK